MAAEAVGNYEHSPSGRSAIPILPTTLRKIPLWLSTRAIKREGGRHTYLIGTRTRGLPVLCQFRVNIRIVQVDRGPGRWRYCTCPNRLNGFEGLAALADANTATQCRAGRHVSVEASLQIGAFPLQFLRGWKMHAGGKQF